MEQNHPVLPKKVYSLMRVLYFMLRKCISKRKLLLDLSMMVKRGKIAGKTLHNLMFNHHNHRSSLNSDHLSFPSPPPSECEFSCTTSPITSNHSYSPFSKKHHSTSKPSEKFDMMAVSEALLKAMEMISEPASPVLPVFGKSPVVRQLRVTDSPFPVSGVDEDRHVDEAAEEFISMFYNDLRRQNSKGEFGL